MLDRAGDLAIARAIVDWARDEARRTSFRIATFGGIAQYVDRALASLRAERGGAEAGAGREQESVCEICGGVGRLVAIWPDGREQPIQCPHDRARVAGWIADKHIPITREDGRPALGEEQR
jgi:hypothetical protein